ncbi:MAG TPA: A24 family peptidase [Alcaligenes faecalis]|nr:A24 family peptidase [Alcaligenes faecalis]
MQMLVWLQGIFAFVLVFFSIQIAYRDLRFRTIPNSILVLYFLSVLVLKVCASWLVAAPAQMGANWTDALIGFVGALALFFPVWQWRYMGAADVKLIAVLGFALGWHGGGEVVLMGTVLAGAHALFLVMVPSLEQKYGFSLPGVRVRARSVPLGAWLSVATVGWLWMQR